MLHRFSSSLSSSIKKLTVAILAASGLFSCVYAQAEVIDSHAIKEWQTKLANASTTEDSITALYNLFDISRRWDNGVFSTPLLEISRRNMDYDIFLDIIRKVSIKKSNTVEDLDSLIEIINQVPINNNQQETLLFLEMQRLLTQLSKMSQSEKFECLYDLIINYQDNPDESLYNRIRPLYLLTLTLGKTIGGDIYNDYLERLQLLINELPDNSGPIASLFYTQASVSNTLYGDHARAVETNRRLLQISDSLQQRSIDRGYNYANYNNTRYTALRRLLANYENLTAQEVEDYYSQIQSLVAEDPSLAYEFTHNGRAQSYYLIATKRYAEAIPVLEMAIKKKANSSYKLMLVKLLLEACEATGNQTKINSVRQLYIDALEDSHEFRRNEKIAELQMLLDLTADFRDRIVETEKQNDKEVSSLKTALWIVSGAALLLLLALIYVGIKRRL